MHKIPLVTDTSFKSVIEVSTVDDILNHILFRRSKQMLFINHLFMKYEKP